MPALWWPSHQEPWALSAIQGYRNASHFGTGSPVSLLEHNRLCSFKKRKQTAVLDWKGPRLKHVAGFVQYGFLFRMRSWGNDLITKLSLTILDIQKAVPFQHLLTCYRKAVQFFCTFRDFFQKKWCVVGSGKPHSSYNNYKKKKKNDKSFLLRDIRELWKGRGPHKLEF